MSNAQHTPGPWEIRRIAGIAGAVTGGVVRRYTNGSSTDQLFMVCAVQEDNGGPDAMAANARLIAAAPELLDALRMSVAAFDGDAIDEIEAGYGAATARRVATARGAIAKATGAP